MIVLGVDPGINTTGYGVIRREQNGGFTLLECGVIRTDAATPLPKRLKEIYQGIAEVVRTAYPDDSAFDKKDKHYDPKSHPSKPVWDMVDIKFVRKFPRPLGLDLLRKQAPLKRMELLRKGSRLSVQPVKPDEWKAILKLADE